MMGSPELLRLCSILLGVGSDSEQRDPAPSHAKLLARRLPPEVPVEIPIPPRTRIVGSYTGPDPDSVPVLDETSSFSIVLDSDWSCGAVLDWYYDQFGAADGVLIGPSFHGDAGFVDTVADTYMFRDGTGVRVFAFPGKEAAADVRIAVELGVHARQAGFGKVDMQSLQLDPAKPWDKGVRTRGKSNLQQLAFPSKNPLPRLVGPSRGRQFARGTDTWFREKEARAWSSATVATASDAQALHEHYAAQLKEIGWTLKGLGHGGPVVGSTWSFRDADDRDWRGTLCILQMAESPQQYLAVIRGEWKV